MNLSGCLLSLNNCMTKSSFAGFIWKQLGIRVFCYFVPLHWYDVSLNHNPRSQNPRCKSYLTYLCPVSIIRAQFTNGLLCILSYSTYLTSCEWNSHYAHLLQHWNCVVRRYAVTSTSAGGEYYKPTPAYFIRTVLLTHVLILDDFCVFQIFCIKV